MLLTRQWQVVAGRLPRQRQQHQYEMQQLHHFAELGQLSTLLLHELANHLSVLSLDVQALASRGRVRALARTFETLSHLEHLVAEVRQQIIHNQKSCDFNAVQSTQKVVAMLQPYAMQYQTAIQLEINDAPATLTCHGDPTRFHLLITILVKNAIEASVGAHHIEAERPIKINLAATDTKLILTVSDWGKGFGLHGSAVFRPQQSTKPHGMGIGLFITKTIVETHFKGTIRLSNYHKPTVFTVTLPRKKPR